MLSQSITEQGGTKTRHSINGADILQAMRQKGIVEDVMKQMHFDTGGSETPLPETMKPATHFINREEKFAINLTDKKGKK